MIYKQVLCFIYFLSMASTLPLARAFASSSSSPGGIITSIPILTLITREIAGSEIEIETLATSGEAAHHFELSPKFILRLTQKNLVILNGLHFEPTLLALKTKPILTSKMIEATQGITPLLDQKGHPDPHAWHDPDHLIKYISNISAALEKTFPDKSKLFQANASEMKKKLMLWKKEKIALLSSLPKNFLMITPHDGYRYLAQALDLKTLSLLNDHHGETLSPKDLTIKIKELQKYPHRCFFGDGSAKDSSFKALAQKTKSPWGGVLWGESLPVPPPSSLIDYLDHNFNVIFAAYKKSSADVSNANKPTADP